MRLKGIQWTVYGLLAVGLVVAALGYYKAGGLVLSASVGTVLVWRMVGPRGRLEYFSVRSRWMDLLTIGALFGALVFFSVLVR